MNSAVTSASSGATISCARSLRAGVTRASRSSTSLRFEVLQQSVLRGRVERRAVYMPGIAVAAVVRGILHAFTLGLRPTRHEAHIGPVIDVVGTIELGRTQFRRE